MTPPAGGSVQYGWDNAGRLARITHRAGKVYTVTRAYDAAGRLTGVTDWLSKTTTYAYDDAGRLTGIAYPNGVASAYAYDPAGRLAGVSHAKGGTTLAGVAYTLDPAGNRTAVAETGVPLPGTTTYGYDAADRLISAQYPDGGTAGWGYDPVGNRTSATLNGATAAASYDAANRLTAQGAATFTYDNNGNRTGRTENGVTTSYTYDAENRLTGVGGPTSATYTYDGDGFRARKTVNGAATTYAWDRLGLGGLGTVIGDGQAEYVHGPAGLQQRVAVGTLATGYAHPDGLGSVRLTTDAAGAAASRSTYEPWGAPRPGSAALGGFGFTGEQQDAESGLLYLRARHYDPAAGRFLQRDSYPGQMGDPASQHRYAYALNNPARYTDPSGLCPPCAALGIPAVAVGEVLAVFGLVGLATCAVTAPCRDAVAEIIEAGYESTQDLIGRLGTVLESRGREFRGGSQSDRDRNFGITDPAFWRWWHREGKATSGGQDIGSKEEAEAIYEEWVELGRPTPK